MAGEEEAAGAAVAEGREAGNGGSYDGKCVFCRIARREEPGTALLPCQVGEGGPLPPAAAAALVPARRCGSGQLPAGSGGAVVGGRVVVVVRWRFLTKRGRRAGA